MRVRTFESDCNIQYKAKLLCDQYSQYFSVDHDVYEIFEEH